MMFDAKDPATCFAQLSENPQALLVDCRSAIEWQLLGIPDLSSLGKKTLLVEWTDYNNQRNPNFLDQITGFATKDTPIIMICRIGGRSAAACQLLVDNGFTTVTNMTEGYEGRVNENGHRNVVEGWRARGLPWQQS